MAKDFDIGQVQPLQGGSYQGQDANITNPGQSNSMDQLVKAVGAFSEGVRRYAVNEQIEISEEQTQQVLANLHAEEAKGQATAADMVRNGQLALGANPYSARSARRLFMRGIAKRVGDEIAQEYESSPVRNLGPDEVAQWTREQYAKRTKAMGFTDPHDAEFLGGFLPVQERMVEGLVGYHTKVAAQRTERDLKEGIAQDAADVASANLMLPDVAARDVADNSLRTALMTGMAPREAYENVLDGLISKAMAEGDVGYLDVAEQVPTMNDKAQEVPMGSRIWAQEKIAEARARIESQKAQEAKAAANNQKLVLEQNKDAVLAEAGGLLFSGKDPLPAIAEKYEALIRKASQLVTKGILDPEVVPKLRKMKDEEVESNLKASERGESIGDYGAQAHLEATQYILSGQVKTLDQAMALYSSPAMVPFRKDGFKVWNDWRAAQDTEAEYNLKGMKIGLLQDGAIARKSVAIKTSIESQWNGQIASFKQERAKSGQAVTVGEMNEFASRLADQLIARYTSSADRDGNRYVPANVNGVESFRDTLMNSQDRIIAKEQFSRDAMDAAAKREAVIAADLPKRINEITELPAKLTSIGLLPHGDEAVDEYARAVNEIAAMASYKGTPEAKRASGALAQFVSNKIAFDRQQSATDLTRSRMSDRERELYPRAAGLIPCPPLPVDVITKMVQDGSAVVVKRDGAVPWYTKGIYIKDGERGLKAILEYVQKELSPSSGVPSNGVSGEGSK